MIHRSLGLHFKKLERESSRRFFHPSKKWTYSSIFTPCLRYSHAPLTAHLKDVGDSERDVIYISGNEEEPSPSFLWPNGFDQAFNRKCGSLELGNVSSPVVDGMTFQMSDIVDLVRKTKVNEQRILRAAEVRFFCPPPPPSPISL